MLGGPKLSLSTINTNLDLDITDYVAINFSVVVDLIDAVGGLTIDLTEEEVSYINPYIQEMNEKTKKNSEWIYRGGTYLLDGVQATAYARIRYTAGRRLEKNRKTKRSTRNGIPKTKNNELRQTKQNSRYATKTSINKCRNKPNTISIITSTKI